MPLFGQAAMLLTFDIVEEAIAEHDDWHTHEHLPRLPEQRGLSSGHLLRSGLKPETTAEQRICGAADMRT